MDTEQFIERVRQHPVLYDLSIGSYKDQLVKNNVWKEVIQDTSIESVEIAKTKLKGLRDMFRKTKLAVSKRQTSGAGAFASPSWPWYLPMSWLEPHLSRPSTVSSIKTAVVSEAEAPSTSSCTILPVETPKLKENKRKRHAATDEDEGSFGKQLIEKFDMLQGNKKSKELDQCDAFGVEVARGIREIDDLYKRELAIRKIRDVLFDARFEPYDNFCYSNLLNH